MPAREIALIEERRLRPFRSRRQEERKHFIQAQVT